MYRTLLYKVYPNFLFNIHKMNAHAYASAFFKGESYEKLKKLLVCVSLVVMVIVYPTVMNNSCQSIEHYVNFLFIFCS